MILLTGSNGFFGKHIYKEMIKFAAIDTLNRSNSTYNVNLADTSLKITRKYDLVIHCAGKAHMVPTTEKQRTDFFEVNVKGSRNLLKALENSSTLPQSFVYISSVAVYGVDNGKDINEEHPLNATDAYGRSKIEAEILIQEWCAKNNVTCSVLRLPLVAGPHPPGNLGAMIKGQQKGYYFNINGGQAKKSIVMADDVAKIIPTAAKIGGIYNLTDGYHPSFFEISKVIAKQLGKPVPYSLPLFIASALGKCGDIIGSKAPINSKKIHKIISDLTFDDRKAREMLKWSPQLVLEAFQIK